MATGALPEQVQLRFLALEISQRVYVMGHGAIVFEGTPGDLRANALIRKEWLEV